MANGNGDKLWRTMRFAILIGTIIVSVAIAYATMRERVSFNREKIDRIETISTTNEISITAIQRDLKYIAAGIDEIKQEIKEND